MSAQPLSKWLHTGNDSDYEEEQFIGHMQDSLSFFPDAFSTEPESESMHMSDSTSSDAFSSIDDEHEEDE
jgi:hypothetical protein